MKTLLTLILAAACLVTPALAEPVNTPSALSPGHLKLEIWVGSWSYESVSQATPLGPAGKYVGRYTVRPILGGLNIEFRGEDTGPAGITQWVEIDSYDPVIKRYRWNGFGSDGSVQDVTYMIDGNSAPYTGTVTMGGKQYKIRGTAVFSADRTSNVDKRELSVDGKTWKPLWECKSVKTVAEPASTASIEKELIQLEHDWAKAYLTGDAKAMAQIEADGWAYTSAEGEVFSKSDDIADITSGDFKATVFEMADLKVKVFGDTAVVTGRQNVKATYKGKDASALYQITDVWQCRDGRWQAIASHMSKRVPTAPAGMSNME